MKKLGPIVAICLFVFVTVLAAQTDEAEPPWKLITRFAGEMTAEELTVKLDSRLQSGEINLGDIQGAIQRMGISGSDQADKEHLFVLTSAALANLKPEYIRAVNAAWYPKQADDEKQVKSTSDFMHAFFYSWNGHALRNLGRADEAIENYKAVIQYTEKNYFGLYNFAIEGSLAMALNAAGRHKEALDAISVAYAVGGEPWMDSIFEEAYLGSGHYQAGMGEYVTKLRQKYAPEMLPFTAVDIEGNEVDFNDVRGEVTLIITWFPGCPGCNEEMPILQKLYEQYHDRGLNVLALKVLGDSEQALKYRREQYDFATFTFLENLPDDDEREIFKRTLGCRGNGTYLIDRNNRIVLMWAGYGEHLNEPLSRRVAEALGMKAKTDEL